MPYLEVGLAEIVEDSVGAEDRVEERAVGLVLTNEFIEGALVRGLEGDNVPVSVLPPIVELEVQNGMPEVKEGFSGAVGEFVLT